MAGGLSDQRAQGRRKQAEKRRVAERRDDLASVMALPQGRRFVYDLVFERCGLFGVYPAADSGIYRNEGRRQVGLDLARELQQEHTEMYILMITERLRDQGREVEYNKAAESTTQEEEPDA